MDEFDKLYTTPEVAEMFDVKVGTVRDWIRDGKLRAGRVGDQGRWRVTETELRRFANEFLERKR